MRRRSGRPGVAEDGARSAGDIIGGMLTANLATRLTAMRAASGQSQTAFAEMLQMDYRYYGRIERAQQNITLRTLGHIAASLNADPLVLISPPKPSS